MSMAAAPKILCGPLRNRFLFCTLCNFAESKIEPFEASHFRAFAGLNPDLPEICPRCEQIKVIHSSHVLNYLLLNRCFVEGTTSQELVTTFSISLFESWQENSYNSLMRWTQTTQRNNQYVLRENRNPIDRLLIYRGKNIVCTQANGGRIEGKRVGLRRGWIASSVVQGILLCHKTLDSIHYLPPEFVYTTYHTIKYTASEIYSLAPKAARELRAGVPHPPNDQPVRRTLPPLRECSRCV